MATSGEQTQNLLFRHHDHFFGILKRRSQLQQLLVPQQVHYIDLVLNLVPVLRSPALYELRCELLRTRLLDHFVDHAEAALAQLFQHFEPCFELWTWLQNDNSRFESRLV